jgi:hypothetical protein
VPIYAIRYLDYLPARIRRKAKYNAYLLQNYLKSCLTAVSYCNPIAVVSVIPRLSCGIWSRGTGYAHGRLAAWPPQAPLLCRRAQSEELKLKGNHLIIRNERFTNTYDHRLKRTGHPVRSAIHKLQIGRLVVGWVTTSEYLLLYVFFPFFFFPFLVYSPIAVSTCTLHLYNVCIHYPG